MMPIYAHKEVINEICKMIEDPILLFTSTSFIVPMTYAAYYQFWYIYGTMLSGLVLSLAYHGTKDSLLKVIDRLTILHMTLFSIQSGYELNLNYLAFFSIAWISYIYIYGHMTTSLAFYPNYVVASLCHASIHILTSGAWTYSIYVKHLQESQAHIL